MLAGARLSQCLASVPVLLSFFVSVPLRDAHCIRGCAWGFEAGDTREYAPIPAMCRRFAEFALPMLMLY